ncbi:MAG: potassium/proton antiporter [Chitinophagales bacterium]|nr:potassium/proton antiporter [Chitinophagales bacterium]
MDFSIENILLIGSVLLFISIVASKTTGRLGVPSLLLFLLVGMLAGSEGIGGIEFDNPEIAQALGVIALVFILFSGGLDTTWNDVKPVRWHGLALSTVGVLITASLVGILVSQLSDFSLLEGLLLGAIISSTDAAAVFSIMRSRNVGLKGNIRPLLEFESGSNDPMAYFLTISFIQLLVNKEMTFLGLVPTFLLQMSIGAAAGLLMGKAMVWVMNKVKLNVDGLYSVLALAMILFTYSATHFIYGNGFLAVYLAALVMGRSNFIHKRSLTKHFDGQAWLLQIIMFLALGLLVFPSKMLPVFGIGVLVSLFLIFIARPVAVFISLAFFKVSFKEKALISWVGLRGSVPIIFATFPLIAGIEKSEMIFNIVFFIVLTSVALQGTTLHLVAQWLGLYKQEEVKMKNPLKLTQSEDFRNEMTELTIPSNSMASGKAIMELEIPHSILIVLIRRNGKYITPRGSTVIEAGDRLFVMTDDKDEIKGLNKYLCSSKV